MLLIDKKYNEINIKYYVKNIILYQIYNYNDIMILNSIIVYNMR